MRRRTLALLLSLALPGAAAAQRWAGFYPRDTLAYWATQMPPGVEANLREVIWPALLPEERRAIGRVTLAFPLEDATHPMNFYAATNGDQKVVTLPISSMRFVADVTMAFAWLSATRRSLDPVYDYVAAVKYQWPEGMRGRRYRPREALGVPPNARENAAVAGRFDDLFGTAIVFVLGHELGHLYHHDDAAVSAARSRAQEEAADRFAMELMRRVPALPSGAVPFFVALSLLEPYAGDAGYAAARAAATHPVTSARLRAVASRIEGSAADFARVGGSRDTLVALARRLRELTITLDDAGAQELLRQKGLTARVDQLVPNDHPAAGAGPFDGAYRGTWRDARGTGFAARMELARSGDAVRGRYTFGDAGVTAGTVTVEGVVRGRTLTFDWRWGADRFGRGVLTASADGRTLTGTWGYTRSDTGGGTWELRRPE